jgi:hypothetical protein
MKVPATTSATAIAFASSSFASAKTSQYSISKTFSRGTISTDTQIRAASAVSGAWFKEVYADDCGGSPFIETGYRMGFCGTDFDGENSPSEYRIYECTEDSNTGDIVLTQTKYTDATCTTPSSTSTSSTLSNACLMGQTISCGASDRERVVSTYQFGGNSIEEYDTSASCLAATEANIQVYSGGRGCAGGLCIGETSVTYYANSNCTGGVVGEELYSDIAVCEAASDDDYDDTYESGVIYDNLYTKIYYGASPTDWTGTYPDSLYGGNYAVCVTLQGGVYYGQALFSEVGYMRGTIDPSNNEWTGNWYMAGIESRRGTFVFSLSSNTMTGTFTEPNGAQETVTSTRSSSTEPSPLQCFRADPEFLDGTGSFSFAGDWLVGSVDRYVYVDSNNILTGSYDYGENRDIPGWYYGSVRENGQVAQLQWYDPGVYEGMYLFAAKNATSQYIIWWGFDWISDFDYSQKNQGNWDVNGFGTRIDYKKSDVTDFNLANKHYCYQLITSSFEEGCLERSSTSFNEEDDDDELNTIQTLTEATLAFSLVGMLAGLVTCGKVMMGRGNAPMAGASDSKL